MKVRDYRPTNIKSKNDAYMVRNALYVILGSLSTKDLQYLHDLKDWIWDLDFVWIVLDEIIQARKMKMDSIYDDIVNDPNL